jgi:hypothetical protein
MLCERCQFGLVRSTAHVQRTYSCFFRHTLARAETRRAQPPSKLESSFRPAFWLGVSRSERPLNGPQKRVLGFQGLFYKP